ncbi:hypothetical protein ABER52_08635 [Geobacillus stearothermophilus]|uniref:hypothetical protein n=1 Tax=Geobacillus stearothermophilus TaxID=1422 RepID=UPI003D2428F8
MEKPWLAHYPPSIPATLDYPKKTISDYLWETAEQYGDKDAIDFFGRLFSKKLLLITSINVYQIFLKTRGAS